MSVESNDQYVVFADIINKIARTSGKVSFQNLVSMVNWNWSYFQFVPILLVVSTRSMLILDQRTLQIKYRVPATEIYKMSLSPYMDDVAVVHVRSVMNFYHWLNICFLKWWKILSELSNVSGVWKLRRSLQFSFWYYRMSFSDWS